MKKHTIPLAVMTVWAICASASHAQVAPPGGGAFGQLSRPAVSPYLNILRGGDPAINYYGLVRPQVAFGKAFQSLGNDVTALESAPNALSQTGNRSSFMTHSRYFMNNGAGGGRPASQPAQQQRPPSSRGAVR